MKFIHAHQMAKNTCRNGPTTSAACPSATPWASCATTAATATTNVRSNSSSSCVDARCGSSTARAVIGIRSDGRLRAGPGSGGPRLHAYFQSSCQE